MRLLKIVYDDSPGRSKVLAQHIALPRAHNSAVTLRSFHDADPDCILARNQGSAGGKKAARGVCNCANMVFKKGKYPSHIGNDDVRADGKRDVGGEIFNE